MKGYLYYVNKQTADSFCERDWVYNNISREWVNQKLQLQLHCPQNLTNQKKGALDRL